MFPMKCASLWQVGCLRGAHICYICRGKFDTSRFDTSEEALLGSVWLQAPALLVPVV